MSQGSENVLSNNGRIEKIMKISMKSFKYNFDVLKLRNNHHLPIKISTGAQILFESRNQDDLVLNEDNFYYILEAAQHFQLHTIESDCNLYFTNHMMKGNSIETLIICENYLNMYKSTMNLAIRNVCKIFHELTDDELFKLGSKHLILILNWNYKIECSEVHLLKIILRWMINCEKREAGNVSLRINLMNIFHSIQFNEISKEDFINLTRTIDENSDVYQLFKLIFDSMKNVEKPNEFTETIKSYGFPTSRGVEYSLVQFEESDILKIVCTMPLSKTSPEWVKKYTINIGGCVQDKWSVVYQNNLFVFGNATRSQETFQFGLKYCPSLDEWIKVKELEDGYELTSLNAVGNYFIGIGTFDGKTKKFAMKYDPVLNVWSRIEEMPVLLHQYAAVAFDDTLLISGGNISEDSESTRDFWMYSLALDVWTKLPNMNYGRSSHAMLRNKSKIYFIGDTAGIDEPVEQVECYDMITETFESVTSVVTTRFNANYFLFDNKIFIKDGYKDTEQTKRASHSIEVFDLKILIWKICYNINIHYLMYDSIHMYKT